MRAFWQISAVSLVIAGWVLAGPIRAEGACAGDACTALVVSGDGCVWTNRGAKAVRFSLIAGSTSRIVTVLAPGDAFREADKAYCLSAAADRRYQATFAALSPGVTEATSQAKPVAAPRLKPTPPVAVAGGEIIVATSGVTVPLPRVKPPVPAVYPPMPRFKPAFTAVSSAPSVAPAPVAAIAPSAPLPTAAPTASCTENCPPVLFKVIDNCVWVLNLNPRPVAFEAVAHGQTVKLALDAADGTKADERAAAVAKGGAARDEAALHMRLKDPFQSAGSGIPVYRARLGVGGACVKERGEITQFSARYVP